MVTNIKQVHVVDSHTGGEPTRVVISGGPDLTGRSMKSKQNDFRLMHDSFRSAIINEPRGWDVLVGALLVQPMDPSCIAGAIFFNNVGFLDMCGHGTIGVAATLAYLGKIQTGPHQIETPVGKVSIYLHESGDVTLENVPSYRLLKQKTVVLEGGEEVTGDAAWGGNWFFISEIDRSILNMQHIEELIQFSWSIRRALRKQGVTGRDGEEIDHIELYAAADPSSVSRNFVLCPGGAYDRSPCGTGTSAKMACMFLDNKIGAGAVVIQESITGSVFQGTIKEEGGLLITSITGKAYITSDSNLILDSYDPFCYGIPALLEK